MINIGYIEQKSIFYHTILAEEAHYYLQNNIKRLSVLVNTELAFCFEKGHCAASSYLKEKHRLTLNYSMFHVTWTLLKIKIVLQISDEISVLLIAALGFKLNLS